MLEKVWSIYKSGWGRKTHLPAMRFGGSNGRHLKGYLLCKQSSNLRIANNVSKAST